VKDELQSHDRQKFHGRMMTRVPTHARAVIVGGGVSGCSVAYHLAKAGWSDIVLLERRQLTCGTTWHAAGLIGQLRGSQNMTRLAKYSADLYVRLEAETGIATGMRQVGSTSTRSDPTTSSGCIRT
jgi:4-methylaminobutanoate oxidase (formaldehyde-forming)